MNRTFNYIIPNEYNDKKLYTFLKDKGYSDVILRNLRKNCELCRINGTASFTNTIVKTGDSISIDVIETKSSENILPVDLDFEIIFEDEDILVVNKAADMPIHPSLNNYENSLGNAIAFYYRDMDSPFVYRCINRLDRDTSGLTIIAKNPLSGAILGDKHNRDNIKRTYYAIVKDSSSLKDSDTINAPIGRKDGSTIEREVRFDGDEAITHYKVLARNNGLAIVECNLETGRTHQIRVHLSSIGYPLIGDFLYNPSDDTMKRQALHAGKLTFLHPIKKEMLTFKTPLPEDMRKFFPDFKL